MKNGLFALKKNFNKTLNLVKESKKLLSENTIDEYDPKRLLEIIRRYPQFGPSQKDSEIIFLMDQVRQNKHKIICEIGSLKGGTLYLLSQAAPSDALLISIDISYPLARKLAHKQLIKKGQRLVCIEGDTQDPKTLSRVVRALQGRPVDFLFIDGDHSLFGVMNDYVRFYPLVKKGGVIALHDICPDSFIKTGVKSSSYVGGVPIFWDMMIKSDQRYDIVVDDTAQDGFGIGVLYKSD